MAWDRVSGPISYLPAQTTRIRETRGTLFVLDGSFLILISKENPGAPNWIDASGYSEGQVCCRALIAEEPMEVKFRVAKLSELFPEG